MEVNSILIPLENNSCNVEIKNITHVIGIVRAISFVGDLNQQKEPIIFLRDGKIVKSIIPFNYQLIEAQNKHLVVIDRLNFAMTEISITLLPNQKVLLTFFIQFI